MSGLYPTGKEGLLGAVNLLTDDIRAIILDLNDYATAITNATNASPIVVTATSHGLSTGHKVSISGVGGNTAANGYWTVTVVDANTFSLQGSTGNGAYTSGGFLVPLSLHDFLNDVPGAARVATMAAGLASKTVTNGVFDAADATLTSVTGDISEAVLIYVHTGVDSTARLLAILDSGTGLPLTPDGNNVVIQWSASGIFAI